jgi:hypothetical protein
MEKKERKGDDEMNIAIERPCSISDSLKQACEEVKLIRNGVLPKKSWKDFQKELNSEKKNKE